MNNPNNASGFPSGSDSNSLPALFLSFQEFYVLFSQEAICKMFLILRRCFRQMPSVFVRNFCIVPPDSFFLLWFLTFLPPRVEVYDKILSFANRVGLTVTKINSLGAGNKEVPVIDSVPSEIEEMSKKELEKYTYTLPAKELKFVLCAEKAK